MMQKEPTKKIPIINRAANSAAIDQLAASVDSAAIREEVKNAKPINDLEMSYLSMQIPVGMANIMPPI